MTTKDQIAIANVYNLIRENYQQGGYSQQGSASPQEIKSINDFLHNVLSNYTNSGEIPDEYKQPLQSWTNVNITPDTYDKAYALVMNLASKLQNTEIGDMINQWTNNKQSRGTSNFGQM